MCSPCIAQQYWAVSGLGKERVSCGSLWVRVGHRNTSPLTTHGLCGRVWPLLVSLVSTSKISPLHGPHHQDYAAPNDVEFTGWVGIRGLGWNSRFPPDDGWNTGKAAGNHEKCGIHGNGVEFSQKAWNSACPCNIEFGSSFLINAVPAPTAVPYTTPRACASCGCSRCAAPSAGT